MPIPPVRPQLSRAVVGAIALAVLLGASGAAPLRAAAAELDPAAEMAAAEARMVELITADRRAVGLVPYRGDERLTALARERSAEMAVTGQLSHTTAAGGTVFDLLTGRGITWLRATEAIAWNDVGDGAGSAAMAMSGWLASPPHRAILRATDLNYMGVGVAYAPDRGTRYWTLIAIRQADRTGAVARMGSVARTTGTAPAGQVRVAITWTGRDLPLQVLTAGLRDFHVQRRVDGGAWRTILSGTTLTRIAQSLARGNRYEYRARARDRRGNYGAWSPAKGITP